MAYVGPAPNPGQNREVDDISSGFNGNATAFTLRVAGSEISPGGANNIIVSVNNVIQNPNTAYTVSGSTITFTSAPTLGHAFFGLVLGQGIDAQTVADQVITNAKISNTAGIAGSKINPDFADVNAVTKRFMILPKVTTTERGNLTGLESGAFIYNETLNKLQIYNGSAWETVTSST